MRGILEQHHGLAHSLGPALSAAQWLRDFWHPNSSGWLRSVVLRTAHLDTEAGATVRR